MSSDWSGHRSFLQCRWASLWLDGGRGADTLAGDAGADLLYDDAAGNTLAADAADRRYAGHFAWFDQTFTDPALRGLARWLAADGQVSRGDVLRLFLLEKAFYEIEYELAHRPDWLRVALSGALRILHEGETR